MENREVDNELLSGICIGIDNELDVDLTWKLSTDFYVLLHNQIYPELKNFTAHCSLCDKYLYRSKNKFQYCFGCPLVIITNDYEYNENGCIQNNHPFQIWKYERTSETAQAVLDMLLKIKV